MEATKGQLRASIAHWYKMFLDEAKRDFPSYRLGESPNYLKAKKKVLDWYLDKVIEAASGIENAKLDWTEEYDALHAEMGYWEEQDLIRIERARGYKD